MKNTFSVLVVLDILFPYLYHHTEICRSAFLHICTFFSPFFLPSKCQLFFTDASCVNQRQLHFGQPNQPLLTLSVLLYFISTDYVCLKIKNNMSRLLPGVLRAAEVPLVLGGVMPTWAVMPLLHEPVWDIWASAAAF